MDWLQAPRFPWLEQKENGGNSFLTGMQIGVGIAKQKADERRQAILMQAQLRALGLREKQLTEALKAKEQTAIGMSELTGVLSKWSGMQQLDSPEAEAEFWQTAQKFPYAQNSSNFDNLATIFQRSREYKSRAEMARTRVDATAELENTRQTHRLELATLRSQLRQQADAANPNQSRFDLNKSDEIAYRSELTSLEKAFDQGMIADLDEYNKKKESVVSKYKALARKPADAGSTNAPANKTLKFNPDTGLFE